MSVQSTSKISSFTRYATHRPSALEVVVRNAFKNFAATAHRAVLMLGIVAIAAWCVLFIRPEFADRLKTLSPFSTPEQKVTAVAVSAPPLTNLMDGPSPAFAKAATEQKAAIATLTDEGVHMPSATVEQQRVTKWISKRYRVAGDATNMLVSAAYTTAKDTKLDPLLILAVVAIESRFNPFAESPMGAQGLMQVMSKVHHKRFQNLGGPQAALNPVANIKVGASILKEYVRRGGSVEAGLKLYVGAGDMETDGGYGARVLAEYHRLTQVAIGKIVPITAGFAPPPVKDVAPINAEPADPKPELPTEAAVPPSTASALKQIQDHPTSL